MSKGLIFFCCACAILLFTIINLSVGPIVSKKVNGWGTQSCQKAKDEYDSDIRTGDQKKYGSEWDFHECERTKGMHDIEYTSFIFNIVIGFVCGLLGLLHLFDAKKEFVSKTGIIGLICGIIGFIFSFVYVILNGLVYTTYDTGILKRDSDGAFAERIGSTNDYKCLYYDSPFNSHSIHATYSDLIKKQYNYDKDLSKLPSTHSSCVIYSNICYSAETHSYTDFGLSNNNCEKLYATPINSITNKDLSDRFLTTLLLSLFVCLANIGLAIFGFLLFRTPSEF